MNGGHVARTGEMRKAYNILVGKPERKRPDVHGRIILQLILRK